MAENVKETKPPEPPPKPPEVPKPTEQSNSSETPGRPHESQQSAQQDAHNAAQSEHTKATHFDSVGAGYDRVTRADLPADWMRARSHDFTPRPGGALENSIKTCL